MKKNIVNFVSDGVIFSPKEYLEKLSEINSLTSINSDHYGKGGVTESMEIEFARITGKEKAIYLPTGTMANQLAVKLLNGNNTKVIVPDNSHIYRDEADAAQSVHGKRLIPAGQGKLNFDLDELESLIDYMKKNEVCDSGLGTVVIENPVRSADGVFVPAETVKQISDYCRSNGYKLHLDGSRLHIAAAYSGVSVSEYSSYFDTVYISLYKYLNASGGAVLCGNSKLIDMLPHYIKIHGGNILQNWNNTAMALHYLEGIDDRWKKMIKTSDYLFTELNKTENVSINFFSNGTNVSELRFSNSVNQAVFKEYLYKEHKILLGRTDEHGIVKLFINESILSADTDELVDTWKKGISKSLNHIS